MSTAEELGSKIRKWERGFEKDFRSSKWRTVKFFGTVTVIILGAASYFGTRGGNAAFWSMIAEGTLILGIVAVSVLIALLRVEDYCIFKYNLAAGEHGDAFEEDEGPPKGIW